MSEYIVDTGLIDNGAFRVLLKSKVPEAEMRGEIVRCGDCKHFYKTYCKKRISQTESPADIFWVPVNQDGFCAWGEKVRGDDR